jgi:nicotinamide-nucleotide adenylyltransferase
MKPIRNRKRALFIGRFQPFHNGHARVIKDILRENGRITIVIGGPAKANDKNPFSFAERERMIRSVMRDEWPGRYVIRKVTDVDDDAKWSGKIKRLGKFDLAYSRNPWVLRCLKKAGIPVKKHAFYQRYKNCGRVIRGRMEENRRWKSLVPPAVYGFIRARAAGDENKKLKLSYGR